MMKPETKSLPNRSIKVKNGSGLQIDVLTLLRWASEVTQDSIQTAH
jgi:hypothetical protein